MTGMDNRRDGRPQPAGTDGGRRGRLASALRVNLLRRKKQAQARIRESEVSPSTNEPGASHDSAEIIPDKTNGSAISTTTAGAS